MAEYPLNKKGAISSRIDSPAYNFEPCNDFCNRVGTRPRCLQTTMNVSIFLSKLLIHPTLFFYPSTLLVRFLRA
ncbi:hypothetical protein PHLH6_13490 [Pseudomonas sp. Seg1]|nr:hypothetical protein PHLH6_13490 [Pseudomonas sp. Seg1]